MGRMITYAVIGSLVALFVHSGQAQAQIQAQARVHTQEHDPVTPKQVSLLMDQLAETGLDTERTNRHAPPLRDALPVCERRCETKFVRGYESCAAVFEKLSRKDLTSDSQQTANMCGRAALSGLNICRTDCQSTPEPAATLAD